MSLAPVLLSLAMEYMAAVYASSTKTERIVIVSLGIIQTSAIM